MDPSSYHGSDSGDITPHVQFGLHSISTPQNNIFSGVFQPYLDREESTDQNVAYSHTFLSSLLPPSSDASSRSASNLFQGSFPIRSIPQQRPGCNIDFALLPSSVWIQLGYSTTPPEDYLPHSTDALFTTVGHIYQHVNSIPLTLSNALSAMYRKPIAVRSIESPHTVSQTWKDFYTVDHHDINTVLNADPEREITWRSSLREGMLIDCMDSTSVWYIARIKYLFPGYVYLGYDGWSSKFDECVPTDSQRLAPFLTYSTLDTRRTNDYSLDIGEDEDLKITEIAYIIQKLNEIENILLEESGVVYFPTRAHPYILPPKTHHPLSIQDTIMNASSSSSSKIPVFLQFPSSSSSTLSYPSDAPSQLLFAPIYSVNRSLFQVISDANDYCSMRYHPSFLHPQFSLRRLLTKSRLQDILPRHRSNAKVPYDITPYITTLVAPTIKCHQRIHLKLNNNIGLSSYIELADSMTIAFASYAQHELNAYQFHVNQTLDQFYSEQVDSPHHADSEMTSSPIHLDETITVKYTDVHGKIQSDFKDDQEEDHFHQSRSPRPFQSFHTRISHQSNDVDTVSLSSLRSGTSHKSTPHVPISYIYALPPQPSALQSKSIATLSSFPTYSLDMLPPTNQSLKASSDSAVSSYLMTIGEDDPLTYETLLRSLGMLLDQNLKQETSLRLQSSTLYLGDDDIRYYKYMNHYYSSQSPLTPASLVYPVSISLPMLKHKSDDKDKQDDSQSHKAKPLSSQIITDIPPYDDPMVAATSFQFNSKHDLRIIGPIYTISSLKALAEANQLDLRLYPESSQTSAAPAWNNISFFDHRKHKQLFTLELLYGNKLKRRLKPSSKRSKTKDGMSSLEMAAFEPSASPSSDDYDRIKSHRFSSYQTPRHRSPSQTERHITPPTPSFQRPVSFSFPLHGEKVQLTPAHTLTSTTPYTSPQDLDPGHIPLLHKLQFFALLPSHPVISPTIDRELPDLLQEQVSNLPLANSQVGLDLDAYYGHLPPPLLLQLCIHQARAFLQASSVQIRSYNHKQVEYTSKPHNNGKNLPIQPLLQSMSYLFQLCAETHSTTPLYLSSSDIIPKIIPFIGNFLYVLLIANTQWNLTWLQTQSQPYQNQPALPSPLGLLSLATQMFPTIYTRLQLLCAQMATVGMFATTLSIESDDCEMTTLDDDDKKHPLSGIEFSDGHFVQSLTLNSMQNPVLSSYAAHTDSLMWLWSLLDCAKNNVLPAINNTNKVHRILEIPPLSSKDPMQDIPSQYTTLPPATTQFVRITCCCCFGQKKCLYAMHPLNRTSLVQSYPDLVSHFNEELGFTKLTQLCQQILSSKDITFTSEEVQIMDDLLHKAQTSNEGESEEDKMTSVAIAHTEIVKILHEALQRQSIPNTVQRLVDQLNQMTHRIFDLQPKTDIIRTTCKNMLGCIPSPADSTDPPAGDDSCDGEESMSDQEQLPNLVLSPSSAPQKHEILPGQPTFSLPSIKSYETSPSVSADCHHVYIITPTLGLVKMAATWVKHDQGDIGSIEMFNVNWSIHYASFTAYTSELLRESSQQMYRSKLSMPSPSVSTQPDAAKRDILLIYNPLFPGYILTACAQTLRPLTSYSFPPSLSVLSSSKFHARNPGVTSVSDPQMVSFPSPLKTSSTSSDVLSFAFMNTFGLQSRTQAHWMISALNLNMKQHSIHDPRYNMEVSVLLPPDYFHPYFLTEGSVIDAKDCDGVYYLAEVLAIGSVHGIKSYLVHFDGWENRFNEWIPYNSNRITIRGKHTLVSSQPNQAPLLGRSQSSSASTTRRRSSVGLPQAAQGSAQNLNAIRSYRRRAPPTGSTPFPSQQPLTNPLSSHVENNPFYISYEKISRGHRCEIPLPSSIVLCIQHIVMHCQGFEQSLLFPISPQLVLCITNNTDLHVNHDNMVRPGISKESCSENFTYPFRITLLQLVNELEEQFEHPLMNLNLSSEEQELANTIFDNIFTTFQNQKTSTKDEKSIIQAQLAHFSFQDASFLEDLHPKFISSNIDSIVSMCQRFSNQYLQNYEYVSDCVISNNTLRPLPLCTAYASPIPTTQQDMPEYDKAYLEHLSPLSKSIATSNEDLVDLLYYDQLQNYKMINMIGNATESTVDLIYHVYSSKSLYTPSTIAVLSYKTDCEEQSSVVRTYSKALPTKYPHGIDSWFSKTWVDTICQISKPLTPSQVVSLPLPPTLILFCIASTRYNNGLYEPTSSYLTELDGALNCKLHYRQDSMPLCCSVCGLSTSVLRTSYSDQSFTNLFALSSLYNQNALQTTPVQKAINSTTGEELQHTLYSTLPSHIRPFFSPPRDIYNSQSSAFSFQPLQKSHSLHLAGLSDIHIPGTPQKAFSTDDDSHSSSASVESYSRPTSDESATPLSFPGLIHHPVTFYTLRDTIPFLNQRSVPLESPRRSNTTRMRRKSSAMIQPSLERPGTASSVISQSVDDVHEFKQPPILCSACYFQNNHGVQTTIESLINTWQPNYLEMNGIPRNMPLEKLFGHIPLAAIQTRIDRYLSMFMAIAMECSILQDGLLNTFHQHFVCILEQLLHNATVQYHAETHTYTLYLSHLKSSSMRQITTTTTNETQSGLTQTTIKESSMIHLPPVISNSTLLLPTPPLNVLAELVWDAESGQILSQYCTQSLTGSFNQRLSLATQEKNIDKLTNHGLVFQFAFDPTHTTIENVFKLPHHVVTKPLNHHHQKRSMVSPPQGSGQMMEYSDHVTCLFDQVISIVLTLRASESTTPFLVHFPHVIRLLLLVSSFVFDPSQTIYRMKHRECYMQILDLVWRYSMRFNLETFFEYQTLVDFNSTHHAAAIDSHHSSTFETHALFTNVHDTLCALRRTVNSCIENREVWAKTPLLNRERDNSTPTFQQHRMNVQPTEFTRSAYGIKPIQLQQALLAFRDLLELFLLYSHLHCFDDIFNAYNELCQKYHLNPSRTKVTTPSTPSSKENGDSSSRGQYTDVLTGFLLKNRSTTGVHQFDEFFDDSDARQKYIHVLSCCWRFIYPSWSQRLEFFKNLDMMTNKVFQTMAYYVNILTTIAPHAVSSQINQEITKSFTDIQTKHVPKILLELISQGITLTPSKFNFITTTQMPFPDTATSRNISASLHQNRDYVELNRTFSLYSGDDDESGEDSILFKTLHTRHHSRPDSPSDRRVMRIVTSQAKSQLSLDLLYSRGPSLWPVALVEHLLPLTPADYPFMPPVNNYQYNPNDAKSHHPQSARLFSLFEPYQSTIYLPSCLVCAHVSYPFWVGALIPLMVTPSHIVNVATNPFAESVKPSVRALTVIISRTIAQHIATLYADNQRTSQSTIPASYQNEIVSNAASLLLNSFAVEASHLCSLREPGGDKSSLQTLKYFPEGTEVHAKWEQGNYYPGIVRGISSIHQNARRSRDVLSSTANDNFVFRVSFLDGDFDSNVSSSHIAPIRDRNAVNQLNSETDSISSGNNDPVDATRPHTITDPQTLAQDVLNALPLAIRSNVPLFAQNYLPLIIVQFNSVRQTKVLYLQTQHISRATDLLVYVSTSMLSILNQLNRRIVNGIEQTETTYSKLKVLQLRLMSSESPETSLVELYLKNKSRKRPNYLNLNADGHYHQTDETLQSQLQTQIERTYMLKKLPLGPAPASKELFLSNPFAINVNPLEPIVQLQPPHQETDNVPLTDSANDTTSSRECGVITPETVKSIDPSLVYLLKDIADDIVSSCAKHDTLHTDRFGLYEFITESSGLTDAVTNPILTGINAENILRYMMQFRITHDIPSSGENSPTQHSRELQNAPAQGSKERSSDGNSLLDQLFSSTLYSYPKQFYLDRCILTRCRAGRITANRIAKFYLIYTSFTLLVFSINHTLRIVLNSAIHVASYQSLSLFLQNLIMRLFEMEKLLEIFTDVMPVNTALLKQFETKHRDASEIYTYAASILHDTHAILSNRLSLFESIQNDVSQANPTHPVRIQQQISLLADTMQQLNEKLVRKSLPLTGILPSEYQHYGVYNTNPYNPTAKYNAYVSVVDKLFRHASTAKRIAHIDLDHIPSDETGVRPLPIITSTVMNQMGVALSTFNVELLLQARSIIIATMTQHIIHTLSSNALLTINALKHVMSTMYCEGDEWHSIPFNSDYEQYYSQHQYVTVHLHKTSPVASMFSSRQGSPASHQDANSRGENPHLMKQQYIQPTFQSMGKLSISSSPTSNRIVMDLRTPVLTTVVSNDPHSDDASYHHHHEDMSDNKDAVSTPTPTSVQLFSPTLSPLVSPYTGHTPVLSSECATTTQEMSETEHEIYDDTDNDNEFDVDEVNAADKQIDAMSFTTTISEERSDDSLDVEVSDPQQILLESILPKSLQFDSDDPILQLYTSQSMMLSPVTDASLTLTVNDNLQAFEVQTAHNILSTLSDEDRLNRNSHTKTLHNEHMLFLRTFLQTQSKSISMSSLKEIILSKHPSAQIQPSEAFLQQVKMIHPSLERMKYTPSAIDPATLMSLFIEQCLAELGGGTGSYDMGAIYAVEKTILCAILRHHRRQTTSHTPHNINAIQNNPTMAMDSSGPSHRPHFMPPPTPGVGAVNSILWGSSETTSQPISSSTTDLELNTPDDSLLNRFCSFAYSIEMHILIAMYHNNSTRLMSNPILPSWLHSLVSTIFHKVRLPLLEMYRVDYARYSTLLQHSIQYRRNWFKRVIQSSTSGDPLTESYHTPSLITLKPSYIPLTVLCPKLATAGAVVDGRFTPSRHFSAFLRHLLVKTLFLVFQ